MFFKYFYYLLIFFDKIKIILKFKSKLFGFNRKNLNTNIFIIYVPKNITLFNEK